MALDNPDLGIKVTYVREPDEYEIAKVDGVPLLPLSQINERFTELDPNQQYYLHCKAGGGSIIYGKNHSVVTLAAADCDHR